MTTPIDPTMLMALSMLNKNRKDRDSDSIDWGIMMMLLAMPLISGVTGAVGAVTGGLNSLSDWAMKGINFGTSTTAGGFSPSIIPPLAPNLLWNQAATGLLGAVKTGYDALFPSAPPQQLPAPVVTLSGTRYSTPQFNPANMGAGVQITNTIGSPTGSPTITYAPSAMLPANAPQSAIGPRTAAERYEIENRTTRYWTPQEQGDTW